MEEQQTSGQITAGLDEATKKPEDVKELTRAGGDLRLGIRELLDVKQITVSDEEMQQAVDGLLSPLGEKERQEAEPAYAKGEQAYEQMKWQKRVEKLFETMLQDK